MLRERLIAARKRLGLSAQEMAEKLLTPRQTYLQWESGRRRTAGAAVVAAELLASPFRRLSSQVRLAYAHGETPKTIAERHDLSEQQIAGMLNLRYVDREMQIMAEWKQGEALKIISKRHGITRQRVSQIIGRAKESKAPRSGSRYAKNKLDDHISLVKTMAQSGFSQRAIARQFGVDHKTVARTLRGLTANGDPPSPRLGPKATRRKG